MTDHPTDDPLTEAADALRRTYPVPVKGREYADRVDRAAARIRELEADKDGLKDAAARAVAELYAEHDKDDRFPWCRICGTADGSWPCITRMVADELMEAIR